MARLVARLAVLATLAIAAHAACSVTGITSSATDMSAKLVSSGCSSLQLFQGKGASQKMIQGAGQASQNLPSVSSPTGNDSINLVRTGGVFQEGSYYAYDGSAYYPVSTYCALGARPAGDAYAAPALDETHSKIQVDGATGQAGLKLVFNVDRADNAVGFEFLMNNSRSAVACSSDYAFGVTTDVRGNSIAAGKQTGADLTAANGFWTITTVGGFGAKCAGSNVYTYEVANWNNALSNCGWFRDESDASRVTYSTTVLISSLQQGSVIRGVVVAAVKETAVQVSIQYLTNVTATSGPLRIYGPALNYAQMYKQVFNPLTGCGSWGLVTSVQGPYQLFPASGLAVTASADSSAVSAGQALHAMTTANSQTDLELTQTATNFGTDSADNAGTTRADLSKCVDANNNNAASDFSSTTANYTACFQNWFASACQACNAGFSDSKNLNWDWSQTFTVTCQHTFQGSCATPSNNTVVVQWSTRSDNYCPRVIDSLSASAALNVYQDAGWSQAQTQFVFGTPSYFEAVVTSSIALQDAEIELISLPSGAAGSIAVDTSALNAGAIVFQKAGYNGPAWFAAAAGYQAAVSTSTNMPSVTPKDWAIDKNYSASTDTALRRRAHFSWTWNELISAASGDAPQPTTVRCDLRVEYAAASKRKPLILSAGFVPQAANAPSSASVDVGVSRTATATTPSEAASSGSAMSVQTVAIAAAVVGGVALVAVVTVVARRRVAAAQATKTNSEAVEMRV